MNVIIRGKQFKVTDALKDYVIKRVSKLEKFSDDFTDVNVTLSVQKERQRIEVTAPLNGMMIRGEEETDNMYSSIDLVVEKLERQIEKYRQRINKKRSKVLKEQNRQEKDPDLEERDRIVRVKKFNYKPMAVEEAVMQMNLIGHNFFVFVNLETETMNVVYRRKDGDYGLLEPDRMDLSKFD
ncbi:SSU ribosomal protein S30P;sigma 54 modulation protein [Syntrophobotulus glycolicus DSM 8271]|uniref:Ribosome hibernation promoting factor n=1 Tax=Syntrophobotulus glycolicus (strain DSM 8271 / FlGlyR) TaxID=645991 RepID=F0T293_SYNGF|nr:ribosome-associated translation inhibitor RaiA [Syntrophobotulus glycolicus]ADY57521.1 SSU ribosomal protein S30P;sigma 54 modulation protein [Syntrophobotulus glycolicus DSM 8271]